MKERKERIEKLLERYFEARTTDAEEQELKAYFREGETDPGLRYARAMFCGMDGLAGECLPERVQAFRHRPGRKLGGSCACAGSRQRAVVALGLFLCVGTCAAPIVTSTGKRSTTQRTSPCGRRSICRVFEFADPEHLVEELIVND